MIAITERDGKPGWEVDTVMIGGYDQSLQLANMLIRARVPRGTKIRIRNLSQWEMGRFIKRGVRSQMRAEKKIRRKCYCCSVGGGRQVQYDRYSEGDLMWVRRK